MEVNITNCTDLVFIVTGTCQVIQSIILGLFLTYIILLNVVVVATIFGTTELRACWFNIQLSASYIGSIFGGISLVGNDLYYLHHGDPPMRCRPGIDSHFFLYLGTTMTIITVLLNTHFRYNRIVSMKHHRDLSRTSTDAKNVILKFLLPYWLLSLFISTIASLLQSYVMDFKFLISVGICFVPITITIVWNILLSRLLDRSRNNPVIFQHPESIEVIEAATFIINYTIATHIVFLTFGSIATLAITFHHTNMHFVSRMIWLLRVAYLALFTIEAKLYLYKIALARKTIKRNVRTFAKSVRGNNVGIMGTTNGNATVTPVM